MIFDKISNAKYYYGLGLRFEKAFEYLKNTDFINHKLGKYQIDGDRIFSIISEYSTKFQGELEWEAHRRYIDIHYMVSGVEKMAYTNISKLKETCKYDYDKDVLLGEGNGDFITVEKGMVVVFFPEDAHLPSLLNFKSEFVKKVVVKILIEEN
ncbi:YhcH/YjgK/YiaL family protein [Lutibacter sp. B2]|nr:YhcH/YjgK/YiaL family protein [Lutibacter sp. B2]